MQTTNEQIMILLHVIGLVFFLSIHATIAVKAKKSPLLNPYIFIVVSLTIWLASAPVATTSDSVIWHSFVTASKYGAISILSASVAWLGLAYWRGACSRLHVLLLFVPAALAYLSVLSNPIHGAFGSFIARNSFQPGIVFYAAGLIYVFLIILGLVFFQLGVQRQQYDRGILRILFITGILLPLISSIYRMISPSDFAFDWTPLAAVMSSLMFAAAASSYRFLDVLPLARRDIIHEMESALVITRDDGLVIDCNQTFAQIHGADRKTIIGQYLSQLLYMPYESSDEHQALLNMQKRLMTAVDPLTVEIKIQTDTGLRLYEVMMLPLLTPRKHLIGRLYRLTDLTREHQLRQLLSEQNKQLEVANQSLERRTKLTADIKRMSIRNQLARELHDQLGHTIIMALSALEQIDQLSDEDERWNELDLLREHLSLQLQRAVPADPEDTSRFVDSVNRMFESLKKESEKAGVRLSIDVQGKSSLIPAEHTHDLLQICREAITNSVKHGNSKLVSIFLKASDTEYDLAILDDGGGSMEYSDGFGLNSIRSRVGDLNGSTRFQSDTGGFAIFIRIPIK